MKKGKNNKSGIDFRDILYGLLLVIVVGVMPLIVRFADRRTPPDIVWLMGHVSHFDMFTVWKAAFIGVPAIIMVAYLLLDWLAGGKIPKLKPYVKKVPVMLGLGFLFLALVSTLFSSYRHTAWFGAKHREEGFLMWVAYFVVFTTAMLYVRHPKYAKPIIAALTFSSIIMGAIGVSQLMGVDFFNTGFASWLVTLGTRAERVGANFTIAHGTLFNPNTFGKYTAMVAPILLVAGATAKARVWQRILVLLGGILMFVGIFASGSLGGLIGVITATMVLVITYICSLIFAPKVEDAPKGKTGLVLGIFAGAVLLGAVAVFAVPQLNHRVTTLINRLQEAAAAETRTVERIHFYGNSKYVTLDGQAVYTVTLHGLEMDVDHWVTVYDSTGTPVTPVETEYAALQKVYTFAFENREIRVEKIDGFALIAQDAPRHGNNFIFTLEDERLHIVRFHIREGMSIFDILEAGHATDISQPIPAWGFYGRETWGSSRGYIWSRSFPLMPRTAIIGTGPDTYFNVFPHHDAGGLQLAFNNPYTIVDKAHNMFLQTWITTGGISAIVLFALFGHYIFTTFFALVKAKAKNDLFGLRLGLLAGISGFVMASMATDSTIGSTGVFFVLLGLGYGLEYFVKKEEKVAR